MLEAQESDPFVAEPTDKDLLLPEATLEALRAGSPAAAAGEAGNIDALHAKGLLAVEKLTVKDCVQLLRRCDTHDTLAFYCVEKYVTSFSSFFLFVVEKVGVPRRQR